MDLPVKMETISLGGENIQVPASLIEDQDVFSHVMNPETWTSLLSSEEHHKLAGLLPQANKSQPPQPDLDAMRLVFSGGNVRFGNPLQQLWEDLHSGSLSPDAVESRNSLRELKYRQYQLSQQSRYVRLLKELLLSRQHLLQNALFTGALPSDKKQEKPTSRKKLSKFARLFSEIRRSCEQSSGYVSSDEEDVSSQHTAGIVTDQDYRDMLKAHRKRRKPKKIDFEKTVRSGETNPDYSKGLRDQLAIKRAKVEGPVTTQRARTSQRTESVDVNSSRSRAVYDVYKPLVAAPLATDPPLDPIRITGPLPAGKFMSFFSLIKYVFRDFIDRKGELNRITKSIRHALKAPEVSSCDWVRKRPDWPQLAHSALCYLGAEVGAVSSFNPLPHFVPIIEFRDRIDHWKWIGYGRDNAVDLLILCNHWLQNLNKTLPVVDYSEYEPPPPHVWTNSSFRASSPQEVIRFRQLESERYEAPGKAFVYTVHGFEAPVGPVKGSRATKREASSKARGHALLVPERPTCVTILSLVRDAASRLPNGEGTRLDLCVLVQDSQFLAEDVSDTQLNNAVSGALDRLHYEKDPCVRYDGSRKVWIYLHRGRHEEDFERIFWACEVAANQRKKLMSRPKIKPKVILNTDGKDVVIDKGGVITTTEESPSKQQSKKRASTKTTTVPPVSTPSTVMATLVPRETVHSEQVQGAPTSLATPPTSKKSLPPPLTAMPTTSLQSSDWGSSDDEHVLPFLDPSLMCVEGKLSQDSGSSWPTSDSGGDEPVTIATENNPSFRPPTTKLPPPLLRQTSTAASTSGYITMPTEFVQAPPTRNYLPITPTVATPTFMPDINMEDDGVVLSQQFVGSAKGTMVPQWLSSGSNSPEHQQ